MIFSKQNKDSAFNFLNEIFAKDLKAKIEVSKEKRSHSQNSLYWMWLTCIEQETGNDKDYLHIFFCKKFLPIKEKKVFNEVVYDRTSTTELDTLQFKYYLDRIQIFANSEINIQLPNPEDLNWNEFYNFYKDKI